MLTAKITEMQLTKIKLWFIIISSQADWKAKAEEICDLIETE